MVACQPGMLGRGEGVGIGANDPAEEDSVTRVVSGAGEGARFCGSIIDGSAARIVGLYAELRKAVISRELLGQD